MGAVFLKSLLIGYSGAVMPGSLFTYTVNKSLLHGAKSGLLVSLGHALLEMFVVILIFVGVGKYLAADVARIAVGLIGGLVLAYMGFSMIRDVRLNRVSLTTPEGKTEDRGSMFIAGALLSASNPYFFIWWSAVGLTLIMNAYDSFGITGVAAFYAGHILADISWLAFISALVSKARRFISIKIYKIIIILLAVCLIGFGASFVVQSARIVLHA